MEAARNSPRNVTPADFASALPMKHLFLSIVVKDESAREHLPVYV